MLGGILIADEVIDVFLPVLYFTVKKWEWRKIHGVGLFQANGIAEWEERDVPVSVP